MRKILFFIGFIATMGLQAQSGGLSITALDLCATVKGSESRSTMALTWEGSGIVSLLEYTVNCGGIVTHQYQSIGDVVWTEDGKANVDLIFDVPQSSGSYSTTVTINSVNFEECSAAPATATLSVVERAAKRLALLEEYTGTACGNCPRGWLGMQQVKELASDLASVIAIHQYNYDDPMYCGDYLMPHYTGAPGTWVDRTFYPDPLEGAQEEGIVQFVQDYSARHLPTVDLSVSATFSPDGKGVDIQASNEFLTDGTGYTIAFALTADGLKGTGSRWLQTNYYSDVSSWMMDLLYPDKGMEIFGEDGLYGQDKVALTYDDVLIASTWKQTAGGYASTVQFGQDRSASSRHELQAALTLPTGTPLAAALHTQRIYATAIVLDAQGRVANAARCHVTAPTGIGTVVAPRTEQAWEINLSPSHLLRIQNGQKYLLRK